MTQTLAIFLDAYRELNSRKLFWITLIISAVVVLAFAFVDINEKGLRIIAWDVPIAGLNSKVVPPAMFYKSMFLTLGVGFWLSWLATILALVSTAGIFPDLIAAGSIDLMLAKPLGRLRLFLTKYATGLLFVALQVSVFSIASFFVLGFKGGAWEPAIFLAVPVLVIFFSYLFCICVVLGLLTRSTIASLLLTLLLWFFIFAIGAAENGILSWKLMTQKQIARQERIVQAYEKNIELIGNREGATEEQTAAALAPIQANRDQAMADLQSTRDSYEYAEVAHAIAIGVKTVLPKTTETIDLLERWMIDMAELEQVIQEAPRQNGRRGNDLDVDVEQLQVETEQAIRSRSVWWVVGTSLGFEAVVLALGAWIFCRRDF